MFVLAEIHQNKAIEILQSNRKKKRCDVCYDRGFIGYTPEKQVIPCHRCVDDEKAMEEWKSYVAGVPELKEQYHELFEDDQEEDKPSESEEKS